jgi:NADH:ubiquinone oxidoreductase subunit 5 (subunit L)/multisubunit Na+/H+ antiporter MnhA subunit
MEGPTPVSALIHAATMVTAGIYFSIRMSYLFEFSPLILNYMVFFGSLTCFLCGIIGFVQDDIKKIIAYSTCSQLGYMFFMCGMSQYNIAFFHLINHDFFKGLLFLTGGIIIHIFNDQDLRNIGGLKNISFFLYTILLIGVLSLDGFFFFSSIESKDIILEFANYKLIISNNFGY